MELNPEQYEIFKNLNSKRKTRFWDSKPQLTSDRARYIISTPELAEKLVEEIRKNRHK